MFIPLKEKLIHQWKNQDQKSLGGSGAEVGEPTIVEKKKLSKKNVQLNYKTKGNKNTKSYINNFLSIKRN